jgi:hypothetical protein
MPRPPYGSRFADMIIEIRREIKTSCFVRLVKICRDEEGGHIIRV